MAKPRIYMTSPILCVDLPAFDSNGDPFPIKGCHECLPWSAEVVKDPTHPDGVVVREWHAVDCPTLAYFLAPDAD